VALVVNAILASNIVLDTGNTSTDVHLTVSHWHGGDTSSEAAHSILLAHELRSGSLAFGSIIWHRDHAALILAIGGRVVLAHSVALLLGLLSAHRLALW